MVSIEAWAAVVSVAVAALTLAGTWWGWRTRELRHDEVLAWSQEAIAALQTLCLLCRRDLNRADVEADSYEAIWFSTSILIERGRLFFRNAQAKGYSRHKATAYQGYRTEILDQLLIAHLEAIWFSTLNLIERGRLFFRNAQAKGYGRHKETAYQGYRTEILDQLLIAHLIAGGFPDALDEDRTKMSRLAEKCRARFVSLAQKEVGRARTRSPDPSVAGVSITLDYLLNPPTSNSYAFDRTS
ncbi:hypothetical protein [Novosphingobium sp.]|uniref:hypothetical protein n=1 Tax=Novosphingobium sp. TaxID=1874826 RepID=UPI001EC33070|nr:hypothetical protein [Novosphingobium sp.]MBK6800125.1 hypothetical protein [Novosphingobium sp.]MBK9010859.1 hypothetical protein [Novosphingobium sp.]